MAENPQKLPFFCFAKFALNISRNNISHYIVPIQVTRQNILKILAFLTIFEFFAKSTIILIRSAQFSCNFHAWTLWIVCMTVGCNIPRHSLIQSSGVLVPKSVTECGIIFFGDVVSKSTKLRLQNILECNNKQKDV